MCFYGESEAVLMSTHNMCFFVLFVCFFGVFFENQHKLFLEGFNYLQIPMHLNCSSVLCPNYLGFYGFDFLGKFTVKILKI